MFASIRNFLFRHRRKFYFSAGIAGTMYLASKYAEYKLLQWHDKQTHSMIEKHKRRQHYEKTRQTANATALNLSSSITKIVLDELDTEQIIQALRNKPTNKLLLWEDLKVQGFSRTIATIYSSVLVGCLVHVKLMLLGGYSFGDSVKKQRSEIKVSPEDQEKYLSHLQNFIESGLPLLLNKIRKATANIVKSLSLDQSLTLEQLEGTLKNITLLLAGEISLEDDALKTMDFKIQPWSRFVTEINTTKVKSPEEALFYQMTNEMVDVIDSKDFNFVVQNLIQHGISHILDYVAEYYPNHDIPMGGRVCKPEMKENGESKVEESTTEIAVKSHFTKSSLPVAKLVPILSDLVCPCLSPAPGHLLQFVLLNEDLENLCFNIYEAFSISL